MKIRAGFKTMVLGGLILGSTMGHGGGCCEDVLGPPTGTECPPNSTLTYDNFGKPFMDMYCVACHDSKKVGSERKGATAYHDFDTQVGIKSVANHVDQAAGAGPDATNDQMPPHEADAFPSLEERQWLAEWIACGVP